MENFNTDVYAETEFVKSLPRHAYTDDNIFKKERHTLFRYLPVMASPSCLLQEKGNYSVTDIASESIIVVRDKEGVINAMANTCRHRGKRLLEKTCDLEPQQRGLNSVVCPYHAWRYDLDGKLIVARGDQSNHSFRHLCLRKLQVQESAGLVFYHGRNKEYLQLQKLDAVLGVLKLEEAKIRERKTYTVKANWKLWVENFLECWHCAPNHPELSEVKGFINQFENGRDDLYLEDDFNWRSQAYTKGWVPPQDRDFEMDEDLFNFNVSMPLGGGRKTASKIGERMGATLGGADGLEGGAIFGGIGPFLFYMAYVDYVVLFCIRPQSTMQTEVELIWLTSKDFQAPVEELTWLWNTTIQQDITLVEETQQGVNSLYYTPGPFQADEYRTQAFTAWWQQWKQRNDQERVKK
ncbi:hypothetical protein AWE51_18845 [Aquimarina aggregata]|uniref:Rieske domain-containing protein n=1 Tax=Aquimarina aggregata TaxID=1642818 RepID=A0A162WHJ3_9FLAO|nr:aromatic ring-hydroxylating dioxygenase subunit alpha [Aquimarina aggregata]KZS38105.1 hypothetical protein AWE51_18845 [Aquimarina aggregata]